MKRQAWKLIPKAGSMKNLQLVEEEIPAPAPGEVTVEVKAIGLNFADIAQILGLYKAIPKGSFIPGLEYSGVIKEIGPDVKDYQPGDRVMGITRFGGYVDHINIPYHYIMRMPEDWTFQEGAGYLVQALTAYYALVRLGGIEKGYTVLIQSAAGGVGIFANRIAKKFDAFTIGSIGSPAKSDLLRKEGYDEIMVRSDHFKDDLEKALGGRDLNIVLESIGGQILKDSFRVLAPEGRMIVFGSASFMPAGDKPNYLKLIRQYWKRPMIDPMRLTQWNKSVMGFNLIYLYEHKEQFKKYLRHLEELAPGKPLVGHEFTFNNLIAAVKMLQSGKTTGKVVVTI